MAHTTSFFRLTTFLAATTLLLLLNGCGLIKDQGDTGASAPALSDAEITELLTKGDTALAHDKLTLPADDNALMYYQKILAADKENEAAQKGVQKVAGRYLKLADRDYRAGKREQAMTYLQRAEEIGGENDDTRALRKKIEKGTARKNGSKNDSKADNKGDNESASKDSKPERSYDYRLSKQALDERGGDIKAQLADIAHRARQRNYMAVITARTFDEGSWIARTMKESTPGYKLKTTLETGDQPYIILKPQDE